MSRYRHDLPQLKSEQFITDGGLETTLVFHDGIDLPHFAAFDLLSDSAGREALSRYFQTYVTIAHAHRVGLILESATWRASPDWGSKLGYTDRALAAANRAAIDMLVEIRNSNENQHTKMVVSGCIGPRGDGYNPAELMSPEQAQAYHSVQTEIFRATEADMVTAITMTHAEEAIGLTRAARDSSMPVAISFTVETDGRLPTGQSLADAIDQVDDATAGEPAYYMINCAHPSHFEDALQAGERWTKRIRGLRANASTRSHAELDEAEDLDDGDPIELGAQYGKLIESFGHLTVLGGCCGTDHRHLEEISKVCVVRPQTHRQHPADEMLEA